MDQKRFPRNIYAAVIAFFRRFKRQEPTPFQRCLAVHIYSARPRSALHD